jgi:hypothetical protein
LLRLRQMKRILEWIAKQSRSVRRKIKNEVRITVKVLVTLKIRAVVRKIVVIQTSKSQTNLKMQSASKLIVILTAIWILAPLIRMKRKFIQTIGRRVLESTQFLDQK